MTKDVAPNASGLPSQAALALLRLRRSELETRFLQGRTPQPGDLTGWEFRGINTPAWARAAGIQKFIKGFFSTSSGQLMGYNSPVVQGPLNDHWQVRPSAAAPTRFGFYTVDAVDATARDNAYLHAVLLNYGRGGNARFDPTAGLRDYLVQVDPGNPDLYLGKAYYALGPRVATNFFILERHGRGVEGDPRSALRNPLV
jgi:hypothetical protein